MKRLLMIFIASLLTASLLFGALTAFSTSPKAHAQSLSLQTLQCSGNQETQFSPPLTNTPQNVTVTINESYGVDASPVGTCVVVGARITGGTAFRSRTLDNFSCTDLLRSAPGMLSYTWNDSGASTVNYTTQEDNVVNGELVVTRLGTVTDGFGVNDPAIATVTLPTTALTACSTTGISSLPGLITVTFV